MYKICELALDLLESCLGPQRIQPVPGPVTLLIFTRPIEYMAVGYILLRPAVSF